MASTYVRYFQIILTIAYAIYLYRQINSENGMKQCSYYSIFLFIGIHILALIVDNKITNKNNTRTKSRTLFELIENKDSELFKQYIQSNNVDIKALVNVNYYVKIS
jgi:hypothetical protein